MGDTEGLPEESVTAGVRGTLLSCVKVDFLLRFGRSSISIVPPLFSLLITNRILAKLNPLLPISSEKRDMGKVQ